MFLSVPFSPYIVYRGLEGKAEEALVVAVKLLQEESGDCDDPVCIGFRSQDIYSLLAQSKL